mgnify:CR=1 FL=1
MRSVTDIEDTAIEMEDFCEWLDALDPKDVDLPLSRRDWEEGEPVSSWDQISVTLVPWDRLPFSITEYIGNRPATYRYLVVDGYVTELHSYQELDRLQDSWDTE